MSEQRIRDALRQATDTAEILIGDDVLGEAPRLFATAFGDRDAVIVADENTFDVAGAAVRSALREGGRTPLDPYVFDGRPTLHADYENIEALTGSLRGHQAIPIAVGSGTVNDIVKRAAHECERPYMNVATAASMDGYTAFGAAITKQGYKQTMTCPAPRAVLADLRILTHAPAKMTSAGYADLLAKITAGADWIVAEALEVGDQVRHPLRRQVEPRHPGVQSSAGGIEAFGNGATQCLLCVGRAAPAGDRRDGLGGEPVPGERRRREGALLAPLSPQTMAARARQRRHR